MNLDNYEKLDNGVIRQVNVNKIDYNFEYSNKYNNYGEKSNYLSFLRLGVLLGNLEKIPDSILDVGFGNGAFLQAASNSIQNCYGFDISDYPVPPKSIRVNSLFEKHFDVICFFDSLEHFDDINFIDKLDCNYIFISVPWCHYFSDNWFMNWYHRRPNEHIWHFNEHSLVDFFNEYGFEKMYLGNFEDTIRKNDTAKGYSNILSGLFKRK
jgi:hypothetical protein